MTISFTGDSEDDFRIGFIEGLECGKGSCFFRLISNKEEKSRLLFLEDLFNGGVIKWDDS
jgi:hypothetical protein